MDITTAFLNINWWSVLVAALSSFVIGGLWYNPLFGKVWMREFGFTEEDLKKRDLPLTFGLSFVLALVAATILDMFIGHEAGLVFGTCAGFFAGFGWVATMLGILYLFEMKSLKAFLINAGYCMVTLSVMGAILGAW